MTSTRSSLLVVLGVALILLGACKQTPPTPVNIDQAIQAGNIQATMVASDDSGDSATITLTRPSGVTGPVAVTIPSGTVLYSTDVGSQRLITAQTVTVVLSNDNPTDNEQVAVFCMDQFADTPAAQAVLSFSPPDGGQTATTEETEPLHKLIDCMASLTQSAGDKQLAVWAIADHLLDKSPAEALQVLTSKIYDQNTKQRRAQLEARKTVELQNHPMLTEADFDQIVENEMQGSSADRRDKSTTEAKSQLDALMQHDKALFASCGYPTDNAPLFS